MKPLPIVPFATASLVAAAALPAQRLIAVDAMPGSATVYELDMTTGLRTQLGSMTPAAAPPAELTYDMATGRMFMSGSGTDSLYVVDVTNWEGRLVGAYGNSALVMHGLEWDLVAGTLYGMSTHDSGLYQIDPTTGAATLVGLTGLPAGAATSSNLAYDLASGVMYLTNSGTNSLYTIDTTTAAVTLIGPTTGTTRVQGIAFALANMTLYAIDNMSDTLYTLDVTTGAATVVAALGSSNFLGLVYVDGAGRLGREAHACGTTTITPCGHPAIGSGVMFTLGGVTGLPLVGFGLSPVTQPFCGCTIGHDWLAVAGGLTVPFTIPSVPGLVGVTVRVQGAELGGTGGCAAPQFTVTDTIRVTIG